jgi:HECT-domain (ubiquitin-transferase)
MDSIKADHGFNMDSRSVKNLLQTMSELTLSERREFLQFTTGSPKLPIGGELTPNPHSLPALANSKQALKPSLRCLLWSANLVNLLTRRTTISPAS